MAINSHQNLSFFGIERYKQRIPYLLFVHIFFLLLAISLVFVSDYRRFEKKFSDQVSILHTQFEFYINQNEAVLEGLSAFISGAGGINEHMLNRYAENITSRLPHIFMLEVAEEVKKENIVSFILAQRKKGYKNFEVKSFDYSDTREWRKLPLSEQYFPLTYLYPLSQESQKVIGLDLNTNELLGQTLNKALNEEGYQTSLPFKLIEGKKAFILLKKVEPINKKSEKTYVAIIVVTADSFILNTGNQNESLGVLIYHRDKLKSDRTGHFVFKDFERNKFLPVFMSEIKRNISKSGFGLQISKQFQFKDISWLLLFAILFFTIFLYYFIQYLLGKNKQERDKMQEILHQKNKMMAISTLTGGIAHEFNNNLSVVRGFLSLLSDKHKDNKESLEWIQYTEKASEKCIDLTHKLLVFSRYKGINERISGININDVLFSLHQQIEGCVKSSIKVEFLLANKLPLVLLSEDDFKEIIMNLVGNANEAIKNNGSIILKTDVSKLSAYAEFEVAEESFDENYVHLSITDSGVGVDEEIQSHIFDPFFTTKDFGDGSGMGLAIVYGLVKLNKGYIYFDSTPNKETIFNLYFPILK